MPSFFRISPFQVSSALAPCLLLLLLATTSSAATLGPEAGRGGDPHRARPGGPAPVPGRLADLELAAPLAFDPADPCLRCDVIYSIDGAGRTFAIDTETMTSTLIGLSRSFFDAGITADGRLFGITSSGSLHEVSACDASVGPSLGDAGSFTNGLGGDLVDPLLFAQGPPLLAIDLSSGFSAAARGGSIGSDPPAWCGSSAGDLAFDPTDGTLYSTLGCFECPGDMLVVLDPDTGDVLEEVGCLVDDLGAPISATFGLAFDSCGDFWAGTAGSAELVRVDPETAVGERVPIAGGYSGTNGLASVPCAAVGGGCTPRTQGFWRRQCRGAHPSGEPGRLAGYLAELAATATFAGTATVEEACSELVPDPSNDKCEQAEAQLAALLLNIASGRLSSCCCIEGADGATTVGDAVAEIDALLSAPLRGFGDCVRAQALAASINEGAALCE